MAGVTFYLGLLVVILIIAYIKIFTRRRRDGEPTLVPGSFLWGNGKAFAENAVNFIHESTKKYGNIFTIRLLNQHMTIINDPHSYERMCKEKNFDFDPIQRQVNHNVFSFELFDAKKMITEASKKVKGTYLHANMRNFAQHLDQTLADVTSDVESVDGWCRDGLRSFGSRTMFRSIFRSIFGKERSGDVFEPMTVYRNFDVFHKYFNFLWLGLPIKLFPSACKALDVLIQMPNSEDILSRDDVSDYIKYSTQFMLEHGQSESDIIGHNLVFLHVNYNTFRVSYWLIYYLMQHREAYDALMNEVDAVIKDKLQYTDADESAELTLAELDLLPILNSVVNEAIRYTSGVFMVRAVTADTDFTMEDGQTYKLRQGDRVAIYPPAHHKDPEIFENPLEFKYDRFVNAKFYKNGRELKNPLLAFGSLCPGKKLALTQAKWFIFCLAHNFDFHSVEGQSCEPDVHYHGHEILPPTRDVDIMFRRKENRRHVELVQ